MHHWLDRCHKAIHWQNHLNRDTKQFGLIHHCIWVHSGSKLEKACVWSLYPQYFFCGKALLFVSLGQMNEQKSVRQALNQGLAWQCRPAFLSSSFPLTWFQSHIANMKELGFLKQEGGKKKADLTMTPPACLLSHCWRIFFKSVSLKE